MNLHFQQQLEQQQVFLKQYQHSVRLVNNSSTAYSVVVVETQGGTQIGSMTMLGNSVEILEKKYSHCVYATNASVLGAKVGFTG